MQLIQNEEGSSLLWVMVLGAAILVAGYLGMGTQQISSQSEARAQATMDLAILRASLVEILKDPTFCASAMNIAVAGSAPALGPSTTTIPLTQVKLGAGAGSVFIESAPLSSSFNSLRISAIKLINLGATGIPNQYTGSLHVDVTMPTQALGTRASSIADIPITISNGIVCTGGP